MRVRFVVFGTIGALATVFGVGLLVAPEFLLDIGPVERLVTFITGTDPTLVGLAAGLVAAAYVGVTARSRPEPETVPSVTSADSRFDAATSRPPESVTADPESLAASRLDTEIQEGIETGGRELQELRSALFQTTTAVYADATGLDRQSAQTAVTRGEWTSDPIAVAFLAGPDGPRPPLWRRLRLWLTPARERRYRIERTITALERVQERR